MGLQSEHNWGPVEAVALQMAVLAGVSASADTEWGVIEADRRELCTGGTAAGASSLPSVNPCRALTRAGAGGTSHFATDDSPRPSLGLMGAHDGDLSESSSNCSRS